MTKENKMSKLNSQEQRAIDMINDFASLIKQGFTDYEKVVCIQRLLKSYYEIKGNVIVDDYEKTIMARKKLYKK
jgi:hypothetical protein